MFNNLIAIIKQWLDRNSHGAPTNKPKQCLLECLEKASIAVKAEHLTMLRGNISRNQFEQNFNEIARNHYYNLKLKTRLMISLKRFKDKLKLEL